MNIEKQSSCEDASANSFPSDQELTTVIRSTLAKLSSRLHKNPIEALLLAFGTGFLISLFLRKK